MNKSREFTLSANAWADLYRENGRIDFDTGMEVIHNADAYPGVMPLVLEFMQQPERSEEIGVQLAELLADIVVREFQTEVQAIEDRESELDAYDHNEYLLINAGM